MGSPASLSVDGFWVWGLAQVWHSIEVGNLSLLFVHSWFLLAMYIKWYLWCLKIFTAPRNTALHLPSPQSPPSQAPWLRFWHYCSLWLIKAVLPLMISAALWSLLLWNPTIPIENREPSSITVSPTANSGFQRTTTKELLSWHPPPHSLLFTLVEVASSGLFWGAEPEMGIPGIS